MKRSLALTLAIALTASALAAGAGVGLGFPLGSVSGVVQAYFLTGFSDLDGTHIFGVDLGVGIPVGGGGM